MRAKCILNRVPVASKPPHHRLLHNASKTFVRNRLRTIMGVVAATAGVGGYVLYERGAMLPVVKSHCAETKKSTAGTCEPVPRQRLLDEAVQFSRDLISMKKDEAGVPGIVVAVSVDGETVWAEGIGYADVENRVPCSRNTVMRIGSISKPIAMTAVAKLWEEGKIDLDKPIQYYVPSFPEKTYQGKKVTLTLRHLLSHLGGIRHYKETKKSNKEGSKVEGNKSDNNVSDAELEEFYLNRKFKNVEESLQLFKDDPLLSEPGTKYLYTTFGWTLISAAVESASKESFPKYLNKILKTVGMNRTFLDKNEPIIYNRSRFYQRNDKGMLANTPCVDSSYKWAGGGLLSNVDDLLLYGNAMLFSLQTPEKGDGEAASTSPGFLKSSTVEALWTPPPETSRLWGKSGTYAYGLGWVLTAEEAPCGGCKERPPFIASHTGGSVGGTSALVVAPTPCEGDARKCRWKDAPRGVVVVVLGNMSSATYGRMASEIAQKFASLAK